MQDIAEQDVITKTNPPATLRPCMQQVYAPSSGVTLNSRYSSLFKMHCELLSTIFRLLIYLPKLTTLSQSSGMRARCPIIIGMIYLHVVCMLASFLTSCTQDPCTHFLFYMHSMHIYIYIYIYWYNRRLVTATRTEFRCASTRAS
jgi:hypothetical protein